MNSDEHQSMASSEGMEPAADPSAEETANGENSDRTTEDRIQRTQDPQVDITRREKSASHATTEHAHPRRSRTAPRSATPGGTQPPREFITGIEHKTKFMRDRQHDASRKFRINSGDINSQQTTVNKWRQNVLDTGLLVKQRKRKEGARQSTGTSSDLSRPFPNRKLLQLNRSAEVRIRHTLEHLAAMGNSLGKANPPITANKFPCATTGSPDTMKACEIPKRQRMNRAATPSSETIRLEASAIQSEEMTENLKPLEADSFSLNLEQTDNSTDPNVSDNLKQGINNVGLWIDPQNSPKSGHRGGSNSLQSTPRSPKCWSTTPRGSSNKRKFQPIPDNIRANKSRESFANTVRNKTTTIKREPVTFTTQFVPLLRWTNKTNSEGLFEPYSHEGGSNSRPNSTNSNANPDDDNASNDRTPEGELSNKQSKETTSSNGKAVQNECYMEQQQGAADEDYGILHPSLMNTSGEGENLGNVRRAKNKSTTQNGTLSKDSDRSHSRNHMTPIKQAWKPTGPQQIVSGCALWSATTSPLLKRPQSVRNIAMAKQPAAYMRSTSRLAGDFARRLTSAGIKDQQEATGNMKPMWK